jgi:hypothetical protein
VWDKIVGWLNLDNSIEGKGHLHFLNFRNLLNAVKSNKVKSLIWTAVVWCIWSLRNKVVFQGDFKSVEKVMWGIKLISWSWVSSYHPAISVYSFASWCNNPITCLQIC